MQDYPNGWQTISGENEAGACVSHVVPINDLKEHQLIAECWCNPTLDDEYMIATHNSADNREAFERGERKES